MPGKQGSAGKAPRPKPRTGARKGARGANNGASVPLALIGAKTMNSSPAMRQAYQEEKDNAKRTAAKQAKESTSGGSRSAAAKKGWITRRGR